MNERNHSETPTDLQPDGGLYKNLNVSTRTLGIVIIAGCILLCLLMYLGTRKDGYAVSYNSKGGSDVPSQVYQFQDALSLADAPVREGYRFTGWYTDENCTMPADSSLLVEGDMQLFAGWEPETD